MLSIYINRDQTKLLGDEIIGSDNDYFGIDVTPVLSSTNTNRWELSLSGPLKHASERSFHEIHSLDSTKQRLPAIVDTGSSRLYGPAEDVFIISEEIDARFPFNGLYFSPSCDRSSLPNMIIKEGGKKLQ